MVGRTVMQRAMRAAAVIASGLVLWAGAVNAAAAEDIRVALDQAFPIRLVASAEGVAIGNPAIAGVSVQNDQLLFITGRSYGTTNLVVVGSNGRLLYSGRVIVSAEEADGTVIVTRGLETTRMECAPQCRPRPDIGDGPQSFAAANNQISGHASIAGGN